MNLWEEILARIEAKVNRHSFYTWFKPTTFLSEDRSAVTVRVPNTLFKDWLTKHYLAVINEAMSDIKRPNLTVNFVADVPQGDGQTDGPSIQLDQLDHEEVTALESNVPAGVPGPAGLNP